MNSMPIRHVVRWGKVVRRTQKIQFKIFPNVASAAAENTLGIKKKQTDVD